MNLVVVSIIDIGFSGGPSNNYPWWLDGLREIHHVRARVIVGEPDNTLRKCLPVMELP